MKREGRQHGMVRTYPILPSPINPRPISAGDSPPLPTTGVFAKAYGKPTNHSKFTGKCGVSRCKECHIHPCTKSKDKAKGAHKSRSHDVSTNHRLVTWRVVDGGHLSNSNGFSATGMLDRLAAAEGNEDYDDDDDNDYYGGDYVNEAQVQEIDGDEDENEEGMSFCDVGFVVEQVEDWCFVEELQ